MYIFDNENSSDNALVTDAFFSQTRSIDAKVEIVGADGNVIDALNSADDLISLNITRSIQSEDDFIGCAISKQYTVSLIDREKKYDFTGLCIKPYVGVKIGEDSTYYAPFPNGNVYESTYDSVKKIWSITCYDDMQRLNNVLLRNFEASMPVLTLRQYASQICDLVGISLSSKPFFNENITLSVNNWDDDSPIGDDDPYRPNFSGNEYLREVIAKIAQAALSNAVINRDGELEFVSAAGGYIEGTSPNITAGDYFSFSTDETFGPVNTIVLSRGETEDNIYYPAVDHRDEVYMDEDHTMTVEEHMALYGVHELKIFYNPFFDRSTGDATVDTRETYTQGIFETMRGKTYVAYKLEYRGNPAFDEGDRIKIEDIRGNTIETTYFSDALTYNGGLKVSSEGKIISQTQTEYDKASSVNNILRETQIKVDKNEGTITLLTSQLNEVSDSLSNYPTTEYVKNTLIADAKKGLTNTFAQTGGTNMLKNTAPYFGSGTSWEYWNGNVGRMTETKSANGYALLLKKGTVSQQVTLAENTYSMGFKYKILNPAAALGKVRYNGKEFDLLQERKSQEIYTTGQVDVGSLTIELESDLDDAFEIYDLMLNTGSINMEWMQNVNETVSDTVNISKGIEVTSSITKTKTRMDSDGFRVLNTSGESILSATYKDDVANVETAYLTSVNGAEISGLSIQKIESEVWISGI